MSNLLRKTKSAKNDTCPGTPIEYLPEIIVEARHPTTYIDVMSRTLEKRVECLENEFFELRAQILNSRQRKKDWRSTVGTLEDDEITRDAERLGREYRQEQSHQEKIAGS